MALPLAANYAIAAGSGSGIIYSLVEFGCLADRYRSSAGMTTGSLTISDLSMNLVFLREHRATFPLTPMMHGEPFSPTTSVHTRDGMEPMFNLYPEPEKRPTT